MQGRKPFLVLTVHMQITAVPLYKKIINVPKITNTFLSLFLNKILVIWAVRIVNGEDPDQTASSEAV